MTVNAAVFEAPARKDANARPSSPCIVTRNGQVPTGGFKVMKCCQSSRHEAHLALSSRYP